MKFKSKLYQEDIEYVAGLDIEWSALKDKTIMITGASGMIGTFLTDVLMYRNNVYRDNCNILAVSRNKNKLKQKFSRYCDDRNFKAIELDVTETIGITEKADYVIHAASNTHPKEYSNDPIGTIMTNIFGTYNLLEYVSKSRNAKMIFMSSVEIYGENCNDINRISENDCGYINCNTLRAGYPESKRLSEAMLQAYRMQKGVEALSIRLCRTYGPTVEKDDSKAISQFIKNAVNKENIILKSDGKQSYSYIYLADAVSAILYIMLYGIDGEAYNVSDVDSDVILKELAEKIAAYAGTKVVFQIPDSNEQKGYSTATKAILEAEKLRKLGWKAKYNIDEGLERTIKMLQTDSDFREFWKE